MKNMPVSHTWNRDIHRRVCFILRNFPSKNASQNTGHRLSELHRFTDPLNQMT